MFPGEQGEVPVLQNLFLTCEQGDFVSIVGKSGCGKTTLLRCIAGLEEASSGQVLVEGNVVRGPDYNRAMVFQEARLFPWLTVEKNVAFGIHGRRPAQEVRTMVDAQLRLIGLEAYRQAYPHTLSNGMAQRVSLARALAFEARVLLMDEPFSALDTQTRSKLQEDLLVLWQQTAATILLVTHDIQEALLLSRQVFVMKTAPGNLVEKITVDWPYPRDPDDPRLIALRKDIAGRL